MFYKHVGKLDRQTARKKCSKYGDSVHLPIPRFSEENEFYRLYFGDESLWLDISYNSSDGGLKSALGHLFTHQLKTISGVVDIPKYDWIRFNSTDKPGMLQVKLTNTGAWSITDDLEIMDSVCIFNVKPDQYCSKCPDEAFCRHKNGITEKLHCTCPDWREGEFCESESTSYFNSYCQNGGYTIFNDRTREKECVCPSPYQGITCQTSE